MEQPESYVNTTAAPPEVPADGSLPAVALPLMAGYQQALGEQQVAAADAGDELSPEAYMAGAASGGASGRQRYSASGYKSRSGGRCGGGGGRGRGAGVM